MVTVLRVYITTGSQDRDLLWLRRLDPKAPLRSHLAAGLPHIRNLPFKRRHHNTCFNNPFVQNNNPLHGHTLLCRYDQAHQCKCSLLLPTWSTNIEQRNHSNPVWYITNRWSDLPDKLLQLNLQALDRFIHRYH